MGVSIYNQVFDYENNDRGVGSIVCESFEKCGFNKYCPFSPILEDVEKQTGTEAQRSFDHTMFAIEMTGHMQARIRCCFRHKRRS